MTVPSFLQPLVDPWLLFLSEDPVMRTFQVLLLLGGFLLIFLIFYVTRDILLRTHSFPYMLVSILLVAGLPVVGFFLYLLIRPARTLRERELFEMVRDLWEEEHFEPKTSSFAKTQVEKKKDPSPAAKAPETTAS